MLDSDSVRDWSSDSGATSPGGDAIEKLPVSLHADYGGATPDPAAVSAALSRFNFVKHRAQRLGEALDRYEPRVKELQSIERHLEEAAGLRRAMITANLPIVLAVATTHLVGSAESASGQLAGLLALGNDVLADAVDRFDWTQRQTFEAYLRCVLRLGSEFSF